MRLRGAYGIVDLGGTGGGGIATGFGGKGRGTRLVIGGEDVLGVVEVAVDGRDCSAGGSGK